MKARQLLQKKSSLISGQLFEQAAIRMCRGEIAACEAGDSQKRETPEAPSFGKTIFDYERIAPARMIIECWRRNCCARGGGELRNAVAAVPAMSVPVEIEKPSPPKPKHKHRSPHHHPPP